MAIVKYSSSVDEVRGKLGNSIFQKCGQSLSIRATGGNNCGSSVSANASRNKFLALVAFWRTMSIADKASWVTVAPTYPTKNSFGVPIVLNGFQLFILCNRVRQLISNFPDGVGKAYSVTPYFNIAIQRIVLTPLSFKFTLFDVLLSETNILIYLSDPLNYPQDGTMPNMRYFANISSRPSGVVDLSTEFGAFYNVMPVHGQFIWILTRTWYSVSNSWVDVPLLSHYVNQLP
jgi:hypothetical protein